MAASIAAHLAVLGVLLTHRWDLALPAEQPDSPWEHIVRIELAPRANTPVAAATRPSPILGRPAQAGELPLPSPPGPPAATAPAMTQATPGPAPTFSGPSATGPGVGIATAGDLGRALRHGVLGCANLSSLGRAQREACEDRLGAGAKHETVLAEGRDPRIQAYFDAVAKAKAPDKPLTPVRATGALGVFEDGNYGTTGHPAGFGCHISWGPGEKRKLPSHWLKWGPCFIMPPQGPLSVEADITPPEQDLSHPVPRSGPQAPPKVRHEIAASADASGGTLARDNSKHADGEKPPPQ